MNRRLAKHRYLAGDYSIADIATWPWVRVRWLHRIDLDEFPHVRRWYETIAERPAVQRGVAVLEERMKIGNPDSKAREALFGRQQLRQGQRAGQRRSTPAPRRRVTPPPGTRAAARGRP